MEDPIKKSKLQTSLHALKVTPVVTKNVFSILVNNDRVSLDKLSKPKNNLDILFNSIIDYFKEINVSWPKTVKLSTAQHFKKTLQSMLWHTTIPAHFAKFKNLNNYAAQKHSKPLLQPSELKKFTEKFSVFLIQPWFSKSLFTELQKVISVLTESFNEVYQ